MSIRSALIVCVVAVLLAVAADAARIPVLNAASATSETLSPPEFVDGYCRATTGAGVSINTVPPARLLALTGALGRVRYVGLTFIGGATSTRLCYQIGDQGQTLDCTTLGDASGAILTSGGTATFAIARDFASGDIQEIFAESNAGTDGFLCISWGY